MSDTEQDLAAATKLLERAAGKLQDYCAEINGDMNDNLGAEIEAFLRTLKNGAIIEAHPPRRLGG